MYCAQRIAALLLHSIFASGVVRELAAAFHVREDLRSIISSALVKLCKQARSVALAALNPDSAPHMTLAQLNLGSRQGLAAAAAASAAAVSSETLDGIRELGLVSAAAAAVPHAEAADEEEGQQDGQAEGSDDEFEEYGAGGSDSSRQQQRRQQRQQQQDEGPDGASHAPEGFTAAVALAQLRALRSFSKEWMTLLCRVYIDVSDCCSCHWFAGITGLLLCTGGMQQQVDTEALQPRYDAVCYDRTVAAAWGAGGCFVQLLYLLLLPWFAG